MRMLIFIGLVIPSTAAVACMFYDIDIILWIGLFVTVTSISILVLGSAWQLSGFIAKSISGRR